ncbi:hypothetical protein ACWF95_40730 [Streptomyces vinaceus]
METNTNENAANRPEPLPQRWAIILIGAAAATVVGLHQLIA